MVLGFVRAAILAARARWRDGSLCDRDGQVLRLLDDDARQALVPLFHPVEPHERDREPDQANDRPQR